MAVDFSRALRIRRSGTTYTYYGLTTAPSHYIAFRSQGAVRYLPLVSLSSSSIPVQSYLRCRAGGVGYCAYGSFTTTVNLKLRVESGGMLGGTIYYRLTTVTNSRGGTSVATTIKVELINGEGNTWATYTTTLPANTGSKTYNADMGTVPNALFSVANRYRVTVTCNGHVAQSSVGTFASNTASVSINLGIRFAPW